MFQWQRSQRLQRRWLRRQQSRCSFDRMTAHKICTVKHSIWFIQFHHFTTMSTRPGHSNKTPRPVGSPPKCRTGKGWGRERLITPPVSVTLVAFCHFRMGDSFERLSGGVPTLWVNCPSKNMEGLSYKNRKKIPISCSTQKISSFKVKLRVLCLSDPV